MCGLNITLPLVLVGKWESQASSLPQTMGTLGHRETGGQRGEHCRTQESVSVSGNHTGSSAIRTCIIALKGCQSCYEVEGHIFQRQFVNKA